MSAQDTFYVWQRNDGYIGVTRNRMAVNYTGADGSQAIFICLGTFDAWDNAWKVIATARGQIDWPQCSST